MDFAVGGPRLEEIGDGLEALAGKPRSGWWNAADRKRLMSSGLRLLIFFAVFVELLHQRVELRDLIGVQDGADAFTAVGAQVVTLRVGGGVVVVNL